MSYEERKKRRLRKKRIRKIIITVFFLYLLLRSLPNVLAKKSRTVLPEKYNLVNKIDSQGVLIMEESVYDTVEAIDIDEDLEGKRVAVGFEIGSIKGRSDSLNLEEDLNKIEEDIKTLEKLKENSIKNGSIGEIQDNQEKLIKELKERLHSKTDSEIEDIVDRLSEKDSKISEFSDGENLIDYHLGKLEDKKEDLLDNIKQNKTSYTAERSGILSQKLDGYENTYLAKGFDNYTYENLKIPKDKEKDIDFNGFKIIDNFNWYLALKIEDLDQIEEYKEKDSIDLKFQGFKEKTKGIIIKINKNKNKGVVIVRITEDIDKHYYNRFPKVSIIIEENTVYRLPVKALVSKGDETGVYIKEFNGVVKFKPLSIVKKDKEYVYVDIGDDKGYVKLNKNKDPIQTITAYDEIFINPSNIKEGQILD